MRNKRVHYKTKNRDLGSNSDSAICSSGNYLDLWVLFFPFKIQQYLGFPCLSHRALEVKQSDTHTAFQTLKMVAMHQWWQFPLLRHLICVIFMLIPFWKLEPRVTFSCLVKLDCHWAGQPGFKTNLLTFGVLTLKSNHMNYYNCRGNVVSAIAYDLTFMVILCKELRKVKRIKLLSSGSG